MNHYKTSKTPYWILILQRLSIIGVWIFVAGIITWIFNLINLSVYLKDAQNATLVISLVIIPVFIILASVLTYVYVGLRRGRRNPHSNID